MSHSVSALTDWIPTDHPRWSTVFAFIRQALVLSYVTANSACSLTQRAHWLALLHSSKTWLPCVNSSLISLCF
ncbi:hypothetical protein WOLCODRAFT_137982 [Wolfiporia cocos MD-104 SS10]|uniref:Uncharacterized protein n=1 Tax=Wolfiporia cocos (strain MD-104) TaxID=742152 RepID=A0A2H3JK88_WOLCO|nr:hypothetical protein WOLCODRAFT_137982 [Wolfiporia cocos MD-104 SS10]